MSSARAITSPVHSPVRLLVAALCGFPARPRLRPHAGPAPRRRQGDTGIGITGCLHRITRSGPPSRHSPKGNVGKRQEAEADGSVRDGHGTGGCCDSSPEHQKPRSHDTSQIAWAKLMARVGEEFPLECPNCGGDIRLISFITEPGPIRKILEALGEPLEPPPLAPARGPPTHWGELVQAHDDRAFFQAAPDDLPAIDIHRL